MKVEVIVWHDAAKADREKLTEEPMILVTFGPVMRETKKMVYILHEAINVSGFISEDMDYTEVPKKMILARIPLAEIALPVSFKKKRIRKAKSAPAPDAVVTGETT